MFCTHTRMYAVHIRYLASEWEQQSDVNVCRNRRKFLSVGLYAFLYMYTPSKKPWNVSVRFHDVRVSAQKLRKFLGNVGIFWDFLGNVNLRLLIAIFSQRFSPPTRTMASSHRHHLRLIFSSFSFVFPFPMSATNHFDHCLQWKYFGDQLYYCHTSPLFL